MAYNEQNEITIYDIIAKVHKTTLDDIILRNGEDGGRELTKKLIATMNNVVISELYSVNDLNVIYDLLTTEKLREVVADASIRLKAQISTMYGIGEISTSNWDHYLRILAESLGCLKAAKDNIDFSAVDDDYNDRKNSSDEWMDLLRANQWIVYFLSVLIFPPSYVSLITSRRQQG